METKLGFEQKSLKIDNINFEINTRINEKKKLNHDNANTAKNSLGNNCPLIEFHLSNIKFLDNIIKENNLLKYTPKKKLNSIYNLKTKNVLKCNKKNNNLKQFKSINYSNKKYKKKIKNKQKQLRLLSNITYDLYMKQVKKHINKNDFSEKGSVKNSDDIYLPLLLTDSVRKLKSKLFDLSGIINNNSSYDNNSNINNYSEKKVNNSNKNNNFSKNKNKNIKRIKILKFEIIKPKTKMSFNSENKNNKIINKLKKDENNKFKIKEKYFNNQEQLSINVNYIKNKISYKNNKDKEIINKYIPEIYDCFQNIQKNIKIEKNETNETNNNNNFYFIKNKYKNVIKQFY